MPLYLRLKSTYKEFKLVFSALDPLRPHLFHEPINRYQRLVELAELIHGFQAVILYDMPDILLSLVIPLLRVGSFFWISTRIS